MKTETEKLIQPLPWRAAHWDGDELWRVVDKHGMSVSAPSFTQDETEFIATATNSHADLVAALKALRDEVIASGNWDARDFNWPQVRALTESALALAEQR